MAAKMDLIIAPLTGHVLAGAMRGDPSGPAPDIASLVGAGLVFRDLDSHTQVSVPAEQLVVQNVDFRDDVLLAARSFVLVDNLPQLAQTPQDPAVNLTGSQISVFLTDAAPEGGSNVWVYIEGGEQPIVQRVEVAKTATSATQALLLAPGTYRALVLAPAHQAAYREQTV